ncbi:hypothetical protein N7462_008646 [Penicillium macrosclerotiorum]|uniref:uncharacterized protein n=1 Tax=Penicillium macrosclerotiorum TaxID=303699 RepID=UPI002547691C|nr:uncharacterized protein N7462_008646 [Penicillium macrosclerotiorum]KAJ5675749.1 hypothetical protein N7462_008646 [Penicillium macrosclerotiorum]
MADTDLESIGRHCQFEYCGQLDFLPFRCESCQSTFCLDHRSETSHKCPRAGEWARRRNGTPDQTENQIAPEKPNIYNSEQCADLSCKTLINTLKDPGVRCPNCNRQYCLKHRLREAHECAKVTPLGARQGNSPAAAGTLKSMFARVREWGKEKGTTASAASSKFIPKPNVKPNSAAGRLARVNNMKRSAKGAANIPVDQRLYLHTVGTADTQASEPPAGDFYFGSRWKVGRVLDDAAQRLHVENLNNRGGGEEARLRIYHADSGDFLEFSDTIGDKVKSGDTIVLLRGAGVILENSP